MGQPLSMDLRSRLLAAIDGGLSCRAAAVRFGVAPSTAIPDSQGKASRSETVPGMGKARFYVIGQSIFGGDGLARRYSALGCSRYSRCAAAEIRQFWWSARCSGPCSECSRTRPETPGTLARTPVQTVWEVGNDKVR